MRTTISSRDAAERSVHSCSQAALPAVDELLDELLEELPPAAAGASDFFGAAGVFSVDGVESPLDLDFEPLPAFSLAASPFAAEVPPAGAFSRLSVR
jgi:hypothetical protein